MQNGQQLQLDVCPHCGVSHPLLNSRASQRSTTFNGSNYRTWNLYECSSCGGMVMTVAPIHTKSVEGAITNVWPPPIVVDNSVPSRARDYLTQAIKSRHSPSGAVMLASAAIDSMLKNKGLVDGSLYSRIDKAANDHLITAEMAAWAHEVRLDGNDERNADETVPMPAQVEADKAIEFATALGRFLYELPAMVTRGRKEPTS